MKVLSTLALIGAALTLAVGILTSRFIGPDGFLLLVIVVLFAAAAAFGMEDKQ